MSILGFKLHKKLEFCIVYVKLLTVLTWDFESEEKFGSQAVQYIPLWKWLGGER
jgi:uncharacterized membrane protein YdcZ (DUF606 family)